MAQELMRVTDHVELWRVRHDTALGVEGFVVKDPARTPETWAFGNIGDAEAKFAERVRNAETQPAIRRP